MLKKMYQASRNNDEIFLQVLENVVGRKLNLLQ